MNSSKVLLFFLSLTLGNYAFSQDTDVWVYFNDKPQSDYFIKNPNLMLSQKAIDRRNKEGIGINYSDVPLEKTYLNDVKNIDNIKVLAHSKWMNCVHVRGTEEAIAFC